MHAVLITFTSAVDSPELAAPVEAYARALGDGRGLIARTWLADATTLGGFHLFESSAAADDYLTGALLASVRTNPAFSQFAIRHFDVLEALSAMTNGLGGSSFVAASSSDG